MDVKTFCLAVLSLGAATGYEIKKACEEGCFRHFYAAGFGSIYPALAVLCRDGLASVVTEAQEGRPTRKVYRITQKGRLALADSLLGTPTPDRVRSDFLFIAFFAHLVPPRHLDTLIRDYRTRIATQLTELEARRAEARAPGEAFTLGYGIAVYRAMLEYLDQSGPILIGEILRQGLSPLRDGDPPVSGEAAQ